MSTAVLRAYPVVLCEDLVRAAHTAGILSERQYPALKGEPHKRLEEALKLVASFKGKRMIGSVTIGPKDQAVSVMSVVSAVINRMSLKVDSSLSFFVEQLSSRNDNVDRTFKTYHTLQNQVRQALFYLPYLLKIDKRWNFVPPRRAQRIAAACQSIVSRVDRKRLKGLGGIDISSVRHWASKKTGEHVSK